MQFRLNKFPQYKQAAVPITICSLLHNTSLELVSWGNMYVMWSEEMSASCKVASCLSTTEWRIMEFEYKTKCVQDAFGKDAELSF